MEVPTPKIYAAISAIMEELGPIKKDKQNKSQGFSYRGIDQLYNALNPLFSKYKVFCVPKVTGRTTSDFLVRSGETWKNVVLQVEYRLYAEDGSFVEGVVFGEGNDSGDKGTNKAMSACQKYFFFQTFVVPTDDIEESDKQSPPPAVSAKPLTPAPPSAPLVDPRLDNLPDDIKEMLRTKKYTQKAAQGFCQTFKWNVEKIREVLKSNMPKEPGPVVPVKAPEQSDEAQPLSAEEGAVLDFEDVIESSMASQLDYIQKQVQTSKILGEKAKAELVEKISQRRKRLFGLPAGKN